MLAQTKGHFFWPGIKDNLKNKYKSCNECLEHAPSKHDPSYDVTPNSLNILAPNEEVSCDYMDVLGQDVLVIKDRASGHIWTSITKDKAVQTTRSL